MICVFRAQDSIVWISSEVRILTLRQLHLFSRRLHGQRGQRRVLIGLAEVIRRPLVLEKDDGILADVVGELRARRERECV